MSKSMGGLAFCDLHGFNLALPGKHCWNFLKNPDSLVARVFKAKYYNHTTVFEASRGGRSSFVWSGLWQAKEVLKQGYKWILGDGETIKAFKYPWLRGANQYKVNNILTTVSNDIIVSELLVPGERSWDVTRVSSLCSSCDAKAILAMPVPKYLVTDHLA